MDAIVKKIMFHYGYNFHVSTLMKLSIPFIPSLAISISSFFEIPIHVFCLFFIGVSNFKIYKYTLWMLILTLCYVCSKYFLICIYLLNLVCIKNVLSCSHIYYILTYLNNRVMPGKTFPTVKLYI